MPEQIDLTTPVVNTITRNNWKLVEVHMDLQQGAIRFSLISDDNNRLNANYPTPAAQAPSGGMQPSGRQLLTALNTANLSTNSLIKRIYTRLITDGYLTGTVTGTPD